MLKRFQVQVSTLALAMSLLGLAEAAPQVTFEGLERVTEETAKSYIQVPDVDVLSKADIGRIIKSLFSTGFFKDVAVYKTSNGIKIKVVERPTIADIKLEGSKIIKQDDLLQALELIGVKKGRVLNEADLDRIALDVKQRYQNQGYYTTVVDPVVETLERNRVAVTIKVQEGELARITKINIVGNQAFSEKKLVDLLSLAEPGMWSWLTDSDQYARTKLQADLETLRSYYMDKGYADFRINSSQVSISDDKTRVYVNINVHEGKKYNIGKVQFSGSNILTEAELQELSLLTSGEHFAGYKVTASINAIKDKLSEQGYAFAEVDPKLSLDADTAEASVDIFIEPRNRAYVRRIEIEGNDRTRDHVIRRELRQFEAAPYNLSAVRQSQARLKRLGFFENIDIDTQRVSGDEVDLVVKVKEMPTGAITASIGYSQVEEFLFGFSLSERNIFGTGNNATFNISSSAARKNYDISLTNPYFTPEGDSLSVGFFWREVDAKQLFFAPYSTNTIGGRVMYGIPLSEEERFNFGLQAERISLVFQKNGTDGFGDRLEQNANNIAGYQGGDLALVRQYRDFYRNTKDFNDISLKASYVFDNRDEFYFPNKGHYHSSGLSVSTPVGDLPYYLLDIQHKYYIPVGEHNSLSLVGNLGYGKGYGDLDGYGLPFFRRYYAGGIQSVRGYEAFSLGKRYQSQFDADNRATGGDFLTTLSASFNFRPWFIEDSNNMRLNFFVDAGNVFGDVDQFKMDEMRLSAGLGFSWITGIGPLTFSYAKPLNEQKDDRIQEFQFTIGVPF